MASILKPNKRQFRRHVINGLCMTIIALMTLQLFPIIHDERIRREKIEKSTFAEVVLKEHKGITDKQGNPSVRYQCYVLLPDKKTTKIYEVSKKDYETVHEGSIIELSQDYKKISSMYANEFVTVPMYLLVGVIFIGLILKALYSFSEAWTETDNF